MRDFLASQEQVPEEVEYEMSPSTQLDQLLGLAYQYVINSSAKQLDVPHLVMAMLQLPNSQAAYLLTKAVNHDVQGFLSNVISEYGGSDDYIVEDDETPDEEQALPEGEEQPAACGRVGRGKDGLGLWTGPAHRRRQGA